MVMLVDASKAEDRRPAERNRRHRRGIRSILALGLKGRGGSDREKRDRVLREEGGVSADFTSLRTTRHGVRKGSEHYDVGPLASAWPRAMDEMLRGPRRDKA